MSRRQLPRTTAAVLDAATFLPGEIAVDTTNDELRYDGDGSTVGGIVVAKKSDVTAIDGRVDALEALTTNLGVTPISSAMAPVVQAATVNAAMENYLDAGAFTATNATSARTLKARFADYINVLDFGLINDGVTDNTTAIAALRTYLGTLTYLPEVIWPAGVYAYATASTNWALSNLHMTFMPGAILRYTGASATNAFTCDAGAGVHITNMRLENLTVQAPSTAGHGMYFRGFSHSQLINPCVRGCGTAKAGIVIVQMVLGRVVMPRVTVNEGNWYNPGVLARPQTGIVLGDAADAVNTCVCWVQFESPIIEGVSGDGIDLQASWGCTFTSGTSEGNVGWGVKCGASALVNKFRGVDFEFNTAGDITDGGVGNQYDACDSTTTAQMTSAARSCTIHLGAYKSIEFATGSQGCQVLPGTTYNRENLGGTITDNGHRNRIHVGVIDGTNHFLEDPALRTIEWSDDFLGNTLNPTYGAAAGSDGDCAISLSGSFTDGLMTLSSGNDVAGTVGANGVVWNMGTRWMRASRGGCEVSFTSAIDGNTNVYMCLGLTDTTAFEAPGALGGGDALSTDATDAVFFLFDTNADTDTVWLCGVANNVDATKQNSAFVPVANTAYIYTISIDPSGNARFFINNVQYGTTMANAVTTSVLLTPVAVVSSTNTTQRFLYTKRFTARNYRGANFL